MKFYESTVERKIVIVRIDQDEEVIQFLENIAMSLKIESGLFTGIGAIKQATISFYDYQSKSYIDKEIDERMEVINLTGNISYKYAEEKPFIHAHITLSDKQCNVYGGHLKRAIVGVTLEIFILPINDRIERIYDQSLGLFIWKP
ncbi:MAG: PPC domain-containing DNA-binding protein [bacterium]